MSDPTMLQKLNAVQNHARRVGSSLDLKKYVSHRTMSLLFGQWIFLKQRDFHVADTARYKL